MLPVLCAMMLMVADSRRMTELTDVWTRTAPPGSQLVQASNAGAGQKQDEKSGKALALGGSATGRLFPSLPIPFQPFVDFYRTFPTSVSPLRIAGVSWYIFFFPEGYLTGKMI